MHVTVPPWPWRVWTQTPSVIDPSLTLWLLLGSQSLMEESAEPVKTMYGRFRCLLEYVSTLVTIPLCPLSTPVRSLFLPLHLHLSTSPFSRAVYRILYDPSAPAQHTTTPVSLVCQTPWVKMWWSFLRNSLSITGPASLPLRFAAEVDREVVVDSKYGFTFTERDRYTS